MGFFYLIKENFLKIMDNLCNEGFHDNNLKFKRNIMMNNEKTAEKFGLNFTRKFGSFPLSAPADYPPPPVEAVVH